MYKIDFTKLRNNIIVETRNYLNEILGKLLDCVFYWIYKFALLTVR